MNKGFTLIEALVVIAILALLTSFLVLHNRIAEKQIILLREKAGVINIILRAKNLAIGTFIQEPLAEIVCGYGVGFEENHYFIYKDLANDCQLSDKSFTPANPEELLESFNLQPTFKFFDLGVSDILFVPPVPDVYFNGSPPLDEKNITLADVDRAAQVTISINNAGQISAQ